MRSYNILLALTRTLIIVIFYHCAISDKNYMSMQVGTKNKVCLSTTHMLTYIARFYFVLVPRLIYLGRDSCILKYTFPTISLTYYRQKEKDAGRVRH